MEVKANLKFLHPFFQIKGFYPLRNQISIELTMKDERQILVKGGSDSKKYKIEIKSIRLKVQYAEFEGRIRDR